MFKFVIAAMASLMLLSASCKSDESAPKDAKAEAAADGFIHVGNQRIVAIECGQVCVVVFDDENNAFVAHMEDGRKVVFSLNE